MDFLCLEFINSQWYNSHKPFEERLKNEEWLFQFCEKWDLPKLDTSTETVKTLLNFRKFLFQVIWDLYAGKGISSESIEKLNQYLKYGISYPKLSVENHQYHLAVVPKTNNINWTIYQIVLSFSKLITEYSLEYLKKCENPECDWIFYDDSKSRKRKWCDNRCASLIKVRKYRAKKRNLRNDRD